MCLGLVGDSGMRGRNTSLDNVTPGHYTTKSEVHPEQVTFLYEREKDRKKETDRQTERESYGRDRGKRELKTQREKETQREKQRE